MKESKEAMKLALDALDEFCELGAIIRPLEVRDALREALAEQPAQQQEADHEFKNFHRILCERFGYTHDERDWKRDQVSLIEWIAKKVEQPAQQEPVAYMVKAHGLLQRLSRRADVADELACQYRKDDPNAEVLPLYESPPQRTWVGLTKEEVNAWELPDCPTVFEFVQFIEDKIKDKNNG